MTQFLEDATSAPAFPEVSGIPGELGASLVYGACALCLPAQVISETQIGFFFFLKASQAWFSVQDYPLYVRWVIDERQLSTSNPRVLVTFKLVFITN